MRDNPTSKMKKRLMIWVASILLLAVGYVSFHVFKTAVSDSEKWRELADSQQLRSTTVQAARGSIVDANNKVLAQSKTVYTVYCDQTMLWDDYISTKDETISNIKAKIAKEKNSDKRQKLQEQLDEIKPSNECYEDLVAFLSKTLEIDSDTIKEKIGDTKNMYVILKKQVEKTVADKIEDYLSKEDLDGIRCDPTTKRAYPQNTLASSVIGHVRLDDGVGINGLEAEYDDYLAGIDGRIVTAKARNGTEIPYKYKQSYDAQDGSSLQLNLDVNIQYHLETALQEAVDEHKPAERACGIIMNPKTGQVYAMATNYGYDPNSPAEIVSEDAKAEIKGLKVGSKEYQAAQQKAWAIQWKNKAVSELYFPGSVFKVITGSSALEEKAISLNDRFSCNTFIQVADAKINCWSTHDHGSQNLAESMLNSCNPAFVQIGQRLGKEKFCQYFDAYGFTQKTGIDLPNEATSIYMPLSRMGSVELASSSFGQTNKITPIQMITAYSAVVNGGYLVTPHVVNKIIDSKGNVVKNFDTDVKRQVISEDTSAKMREILEGVVNGQKGSNCYIKGYRIGGKSGTSQKLDTDNSTTYVASYCAFAPADDPEVIMLVMVDHPTGAKYYGSQVAAPICVNVLSEVLPYLGLFPEYTEDELENMQISVPNVEYADIENGTKTLESLGLKVKVEGKGKSVVKQIPTGISVEKDSTVILYTDKSYEKSKVTVPNIAGLTRSQAKATLEQVGLTLNAKGNAADEKGAVASSDQSYTYGQNVPAGTAVTVTFVAGTVGSQ